MSSTWGAGSRDGQQVPVDDRLDGQRFHWRGGEPDVDLDPVVAGPRPAVHPP